MSEFLSTLCHAAALLSLAVLFVPEKEGIKKASLSAFSLLFLLLLFPKDGSFSLNALFTLPEETPLPDTGYTEVIEEAVARGIVLDLCDRFSLSEDGVKIETDVTVTETKVTGSYLHLTLGKENLFADAGAVLRYIKKTYGVDCEVSYLGT